MRQVADSKTLKKSRIRFPKKWERVKVPYLRLRLLQAFQSIVGEESGNSKILTCQLSDEQFTIILDELFEDIDVLSSPQTYADQIFLTDTELEMTLTTLEKIWSLVEKSKPIDVAEINSHQDVLREVQKLMNLFEEQGFPLIY